MTEVRVNDGPDRIVFALVDDEDADRVHRYWRLRKGYAYTKVRAGRRNGKKRQREVQMARWILGITDPKIEVDHRNRNPLDNRRSNLRVCSRLLNAQNLGPHRRSKHPASGYRGVFWIPGSKKWRATVTIAHVTHRLGEFDDPAVAGARAAEFRRMNMPFAVEADMAGVGES